MRLIISAICNRVSVLEKCDFFKSTNNVFLDKSKDLVMDKNLITANPNAYVDFAIEVAKYLNIFNDENDIIETINFFKYFKNI